MTPEGKVKADIKKWLKDRGAYFFMPVQTGYGATTLDFLVCLNGRFIGIEAKAPGKQASARQRLVMDAIREANGDSCCVDSVEALEEYLKSAGWQALPTWFDHG